LAAWRSCPLFTRWCCWVTSMLTLAATKSLLLARWVSITSTTARHPLTMGSTSWIWRRLLGSVWATPFHIGLGTWAPSSILPPSAGASRTTLCALANSCVGCQTTRSLLLFVVAIANTGCWQPPCRCVYESLHGQQPLVGVGCRNLAGQTACSSKLLPPLVCFAIS
jgi:hypothetical protein